MLGVVGGGGNLFGIGADIQGGVATRLLYVDANGKVGQSAKYTVSDVAGAGMAIASGIAATAVNAFNITQTIGTGAGVGALATASPFGIQWTWNDVNAITGVKWVVTDTSSGAGSLPFQILGGASGTTNLLSVGKAGLLTAVTGLFGAGTYLSNLGFKGTNDTVFGFVASASDPTGAHDTGWSRLSAGVSAFGTGAAGSTAGSISLTNGAFAGTMGIRALSTLTDGADGTNTSGYKFVSFVSNSAEAGNVIRVAQTAAVVFTTSSDERLKIVHGDSDRIAATNRILAHRMKDYEWKQSPGTMYAGPVAQQAYATDASPMLVQRGGDDPSKNPWSINMAGYIPDLIMAVQELLESRINQRV